MICTELRTAFILMDSDRDGRVTAVEIQNMLLNLGISLREDIVLNLVRQASQSGKTRIFEVYFLKWLNVFACDFCSPGPKSGSIKKKRLACVFWARLGWCCCKAGLKLNSVVTTCSLLPFSTRRTPIVASENAHKKVWMPSASCHSSFFVK